MRHYLPLIASELSLDTPPMRDAVIAPDDTEEVEDETLQVAAFESLSLGFDAGQSGPRVVVVSSHPISAWSDVESLLADGKEGSEIARALTQIEDQDALDTQVEALSSLDLEWYDISERAALGKKLNPSS